MKERPRSCRLRSSHSRRSSKAVRVAKKPRRSAVFFVPALCERVEIVEGIRLRLGGFGGFLTSPVIEDAFAQSQIFRCYFQEFVRGDVLDRAFKRELGRGSQAGGNAFTLGAEVGEFLFANGVA